MKFGNDMSQKSEHIVSGTYTTNWTVNCPVQSGSDGTVETSYVDRISVGESIGGYYGKIRRGELLPFTYWSQREDAVTHTVGHRKFRDPRNGCYNSYYTILPLVQYPTDTELNELVGNALAEAANYTQTAAARIYGKSFDTITFLAELGKTVDMFNKVVPKVANLAKTVYAANVKHARTGNIKAISEKYLRKQVDRDWLEGRYGWRTTFYDLKNLQDALARLGDKKKRFLERAGRSYTWNATNNVANYSWNVLTWDLLDSRKYSVNLHGKVCADVDLPAFMFNPFTSAWELTRLSFVVDWVYNVGQALEAMSLMALATRTEAAACCRVEVTGSLSVVNGRIASPYVVDAAGTFTDTYSITLSNRRKAKVPFPPQFRLNLSALKVLDLAALIRQALK